MSGLSEGSLPGFVGLSCTFGGSWISGFGAG